MEDWKEYKLGELVSVKGGKRLPKGENLITQRNTHPYIRIRDLGKSKILQLNSEYEYVDDDTQKKISRYITNKGDVLISIVGTIGLVGIVGDTLDNANLTENCVKLVDYKNINPDYLYYFLTSKIGQNEISKGTVGAVQPKLPIKNIQDISINLPPLATQKKIAEVLSSLDDKIELNNKINANLEQQAQAIFKSWFVDFEPFGGEMPAGWKKVSFSDFLIPRTEKSNDPSIPMYSVTDTGIHPRDEKFNKSLCKSTTKNKIIYKSDIVFGMSREILNWGVFKDEIGGVSSAYNIYSVSKEINYKYLEGYIKYHVHYFKDLIKPASREGQGVDKSALMQKVLLLPPADVLNEYYTIEDSLLQKIKICNEENKKLSTLRDTLLPKLMSGELEV